MAALDAGPYVSRTRPMLMTWNWTGLCRSGVIDEPSVASTLQPGGQGGQGKRVASESIRRATSQLVRAASMRSCSAPGSVVVSTSNARSKPAP